MLELLLVSLTGPPIIVLLLVTVFGGLAVPSRMIT